MSRLFPTSGRYIPMPVSGRDIFCPGYWEAAPPELLWDERSSIEEALNFEAHP